VAIASLIAPDNRGDGLTPGRPSLNFKAMHEKQALLAATLATFLQPLLGLGLLLRAPRS
jgi:hypothetical protein